MLIGSLGLFSFKILQQVFKFLFPECPPLPITLANDRKHLILERRNSQEDKSFAGFAVFHANRLDPTRQVAKVGLMVESSLVLFNRFHVGVVEMVWLSVFRTCL